MAASIERNLRLYPAYQAASSSTFWLPAFFLYFSSRFDVAEVLLLEAIYYLETFRSFRGARDEQLGLGVVRPQAHLTAGAMRAPEFPQNHLAVVIIRCGRHVDSTLTRPGRVPRGMG